MNAQTTNVVKDMNGIKSIDRKVDYSEYKPIGSMALLKFDAGTISPDVDGKIKSESKKVMKMKDVDVPWEIEASEKFGNAIVSKLLGERPNFDAFYCMLKSERELKSLWDDYCNSWLTENVPNGSIERFHQEYITTKVYRKISFISWNIQCKRRSDIKPRS